MKRKITLAISLNSLLLFWSFMVFVTKGVDAGLENWKFYASIIAMLGFSFFLLLLLRKLKSL